jgi:hypothetical protein
MPDVRWMGGTDLGCPLMAVALQFFGDMAYGLAIAVAATGVVGICYVAWEVGQWLTDRPPTPRDPR